MNKTFSALYLALVMAVCLFFSVGAFFFRPDAEAEGRELTPIPPLLTEDGRFNRDFAVGLEPVFAERFALRPQLVTADSILNAGLFSTGTEQVIVGREGYLFFGETLDDYMGTNPMTEEEIAAAADSLAAMADYAEARVRITQYQHGIGLYFSHKLIGLRDNISHCFAQIAANGIKVNVRIVYLEIAKKYPV